MRILYFLAHPNGVGGAAKQMLTHALIMKKIGNIVQVVVQSDSEGKYSSEFDELCEIWGITAEVLSYSIATCIEEIDFHKSTYDIVAIKEIIEKFNPDVLHSLQLNAAVEVVARMLSIPHIMSIYPVCEGMFNMPWINVFPQYHCGDSEYYCSQWARGLGIQSRCIRVAYETSKTKKNNTAINLRKDDIVEIICVGIFVAYKGQLEVLRFIKEYKKENNNIKIIFLGDCDTEYGDVCKRYVKENQLEQNVEFTGFVTDIAQYYESADLLIHASTKESYPGVIVEAMAHQIPVICTAEGGITEMVIDGYNGIIAAGSSNKELYDAFKKYLEFCSTGHINQLISNAYSTYKNNHTYRVIGEKLYNYYKDIVEEKNIRRDNLWGLLEKRISDFEQHRFPTNCSDYTRRHVFYLYTIAQNVKKDATCVIWGTGEKGWVGLEWSTILQLKVTGYIDSKKTGLYKEYDIKRPTEKVLNSVDLIIVSVTKFEIVCEIIKELEKIGKKRNKEYFLISNDPCYK